MFELFTWCFKVRQDAPLQVLFFAFFPQSVWGFGIIRGMSRLVRQNIKMLFRALSFFGLAQFLFFSLAVKAGTAKSCSTAKDRAIENCKKEGIKAAKAEDAAALAAAAAIGKQGNGQEVSGRGLSEVGEGGATGYTYAITMCKAFEEQCDFECKPPGPNHQETKQMASDLKTCKNKLAEAQKDLSKGVAGSKTANSGGTKTADTAKGSESSNPAGGMPPMMPPPSAQEDKKAETPPAATPQSIPPTATAAQPEQKKDEAGQTGFDDKTQSDFQTASAKVCSGAGKDMCPGCPGFAASCPSGNAASCLQNMSTSAVQNIKSNCGDAPGLADPAVAKALSTPGYSAQSIGGAGNGTSGGGAMSGGGDTTAMLANPRLNNEDAQKGTREGGSLGVEGGGGGYSGGSDSNSNVFGDSESSSPMFGQGVGARGLASAFETQSVDSGHQVVDRYGPSLFTILGETIKNRCAEGKLLHCRPERK